MAIRLTEDVKRTVLSWGAMSCIILDASHVFMHRSISNAPVDALASIIMREVLSYITVLVHLLTASASLLVVVAGVPTTVVAMSFLPAIIDGRTATTMPAGSWRGPVAVGLVGGGLRVGDGLDPFE